MNTSETKFMPLCMRMKSHLIVAAMIALSFGSALAAQADEDSTAGHTVDFGITSSHTYPRKDADGNINGWYNFSELKASLFINGNPTNPKKECGADINWSWSILSGGYKTKDGDPYEIPSEDLKTFMVVGGSGNEASAATV